MGATATGVRSLTVISANRLVNLPALLPLAHGTSPHDLRSFPSPSQSLALLRERGTMPQSLSLFAHDNPLCYPSLTERSDCPGEGWTRMRPG